ncbi:restriction endonuclease [Streptomyces sp. NPDC101151]|uniref:restriction endonuclease n=1 Tax=Streptomyces sp. NPDC101151 TaxID=3366115 RepID=UPI00382A3E79
MVWNFAPRSHCSTPADRVFKTLRDSVLERTDVLDSVKALSLLPDGMHVTTAMVAAYFGVAVEAIRQLKARHREELACNGMVTLQDRDLAEFKRAVLSRHPGSYPQPRSSLALYSRRAVLTIAMLLRDSEVARQVRTYLLDMEYLARTRPVDDSVPTDTTSLDDRIDQRITHILGKTVVPMFNALIETSGEHRKELIALLAGVQRIGRRLHQHHARLQRLEGVRDDRPRRRSHGGHGQLAAEAGITAVHRGVLEARSAGEPLKILE